MVVLELLLGIVIGPNVLGLAHSSSFVEFFANLGLGMLFFFAGYEIDFNLSARFGSAGARLKLPLFLGLFLLVRGAPALVLYRSELAVRERLALACYSATALPLVVAIADVATDDGRMRSSTAAALVGAALVSTIVFPFLARGLRQHESAVPEPDIEVLAAAIESPPVTAG